MAIPKPTSNKPFLWVLLGMACLGGCLTLIASVCCLYMWALGSALHSDEPGALGATLPLSAEEKEAEAKEDVRHKNLVQQNFKAHEREFDTLAKQLLAKATQNGQTRLASDATATLQKIQVKNATALKKETQWRVEFTVNPKNDLGDPEEAYTYVDELYVYSKAVPVEMADTYWKYHFSLKDNWYFFLRYKSSN